MVTFTLAYEGDLRCSVTHGPSSTRLITDAPVDNHGRGASFSPTDCAASSLGCCMTTIMGIVAQKEGVRLEGLTARIEKHMAPAPPRRIGRIVVEVSMPAGVPPARRATLEQAARTCPVALSLHPAIEQDIRFAYPD